MEPIGDYPGGNPSWRQRRRTQLGLPEDTTPDASIPNFSDYEDVDLISEQEVHDGGDNDNISSYGSDMDSADYGNTEAEEMVHLTNQGGDPYEPILPVRVRGSSAGRSGGQRVPPEGFLRGIRSSVNSAGRRIVSPAEEDRRGLLGRSLRSSEYRLSSRVARYSLKGRTLGVFGPTSRIRLMMRRFLESGLTEPLFFLLIILNALVLTIQSNRAFPDPPNAGGYFRSWEDFILFFIFLAYTYEATAHLDKHRKKQHGVSRPREQIISNAEEAMDSLRQTHATTSLRHRPYPTGQPPRTLS
ncbi:hypothetical protein M408DRAFT_30509 [Serendipita vermifera MAFF 305830]|uniref:Ion transport domain-containing protein n=1 Tax=Serendipita vermifera MAFF 305830 TaxID=933852 RepID=A0A0C2WRQ4_SERVB|nr:hypothetical protein M408DRAFT_30509 [Serendipita vermifera MAFF 305830]